MSVVPLFQRRVIYVQRCLGGWSMTYVGPDEQRDLGTASTLGEARSTAGNEAFRVGRCSVSIVGGEVAR